MKMAERFYRRAKAKGGDKARFAAAFLAQILI